MNSTNELFLWFISEENPRIRKLRICQPLCKHTHIYTQITVYKSYTHHLINVVQKTTQAPSPPFLTIFIETQATLTVLFEVNIDFEVSAQEVSPPEPGSAGWWAWPCKSIKTRMGKAMSSCHSLPFLGPQFPTYSRVMEGGCSKAQNAVLEFKTPAAA